MDLIVTAEGETNTMENDILDDTLVKNVGRCLAKGRPQVMRFLALRGVMKICTKLGNNAMIGKYELARETLDDFGFSKDDAVALAQLEEIVKRFGSEKDGSTRMEDWVE